MIEKDWLVERIVGESQKRIFKRKGLAGGRNLLFPQAYSRADLDKNPKLLK